MRTFTPPKSCEYQKLDDGAEDTEFFGRFPYGPKLIVGEDASARGSPSNVSKSRTALSTKQNPRTRRGLFTVNKDSEWSRLSYVGLQ
jgi:hypothetical protein